MLGSVLGSIMFPWKKKTRVTTQITADRFSRHAPGLQNSVDIFRGHWATDMSDIFPDVKAGPARLFKDPRTSYPLIRFASASGDFSGQRILELGPLEGAHTYQLEKKGADVVAVEANTEAYLKCLLVKELCGLERARFLYGDCMKYMRESNEHFNLVFCCGILYHMEDPVEFIRLMTVRTKRIFVWTHYHHPAKPNRSQPLVPFIVERGGEKYTYYRRSNVDRDSATFWGGNELSACLLSRKDIMRAFRQNGFNYSLVHDEEPNHLGGPAFSISLWRED